jgi:NAD(P)-dependent dehydrogenase (short-subunit alcohol dehydrogenase family)
MMTPYSLTHEGYEIQFGTNHMGHALLTKLLLPVLLRTADEAGAKSDVRIVNLTSLGHHGAPSGGILWDQSALEKEFTQRRYGQAKLANILFTRELATRYPTITSVAVHPGIIVTDLYTAVSSNFVVKIGLWIYGSLFRFLPGHFTSTEGGALNQTWAAVSGEVESGGLYYPVGKRAEGSAYARDDGLAKKLWEWTEGELEKHGY